MNERTKTVYPMEQSQDKSKASREEFPDGSALVTYPDGSMLIRESALARESVAQESRPVNYSEPPPPPPVAKVWVFRTANAVTPRDFFRGSRNCRTARERQGKQPAPYSSSVADSVVTPLRARTNANPLMHDRKERHCPENLEPDGKDSRAKLRANLAGA